MKYFIDTEFIEGFHRPLFGKQRHFIDLISIGIICEDGRSLYLISQDYKYKDADSWVQKNVIHKMYINSVHGDNRNRYNEKNFHLAYGVSNKNIVTKLLLFFGCEYDNDFPGWFAPKDIEVYGYYADYDWVLFCSLFGRMIDLPKGFPMYCKDLKQIFDDKQIAIAKNQFDLASQYSKPITMETAIDVTNLKHKPNYPKQENEHNALDDAKWNYNLFKFLETVGK